MLATLIDVPFDDPGWVFGEKWDGSRMVAEIEGGRVTLYSSVTAIIRWRRRCRRWSTMP
jgi:bifunctional non-homologous end joining protein LigD